MIVGEKTGVTIEVNALYVSGAVRIEGFKLARRFSFRVKVSIDRFDTRF